jgi:IclR family acetate operon transcriptional repressor
MKAYRTPNLAKACHVINYISHAHGECQLKHIAAELSIPRTTALRITQTLLEVNYLAQNENGGFTLGPALVQLGVKALDHLDIRAFARPVLKALTDETGEASHLAMLNGDKSLLIEVADTPHPLRIASRPGTLVDLHCSSTGKIFLACGIADPGRFCKALELTPHTEYTHSTIDAVLAEIEKTRRRGYAIDEQEYVLGARCIAAPVTNAFGKTIAAIGITGSCSTLTKAKTSSMAKKLMAAAAEISTRLGCSH